MTMLKYISRIITGVVFIFSGTVKAVDPLGTTYKFQDYFTAFNLEFLKEYSLFFTVALCTLEFTAGISVLFNVRQRTGIWLVAIMMILFTPLTLFLALTNPVSDCGCFGDAIHLTNWQTFAKNIILLIPVLFLFIKRHEHISFNGFRKEMIIILLSTILIIVFILYNLRHLPAIDFLPYKKGTYIPDKMVVPEGSSFDRYETTFIYEKNGKRQEFTLDNYPSSDDTTWKFIDQKSILVSKGYQPPIHDFVISTIKNENITEHILSSKKPLILMISTKLQEAESDNLIKGFELGNYCKKEGIDFYVVTASVTEEINKYNKDMIYCQADETTLKTMIRSNPGYMLLKEGTIIDKWSWANIPSPERIGQIIKR